MFHDHADQDRQRFLDETQAERAEDRSAIVTIVVIVIGVGVAVLAVIGYAQPDPVAAAKPANVVEVR